MRFYLAIALAIASMVAAQAIPSSQQIIMFGKGSSASGGGGGGCSNQLNFSVACNSQYVAVIH